VIAIDGPAASGKSSTARCVARVLGYRHIDSGALYRAAAAVRNRRGGDPAEWTESEVVDGLGVIGLAPADAGFVTTIGGETRESELREAAVTRSVSQVARMPRVRAWVDDLVRRTAAEHDVVVDGRDIGTAVFPDAMLKIYLVANPWERARRRLLQQLGREPGDEEIAGETDRLVHRDTRDAGQSAQANDAVVIDTTSLTQEEQVDRIVALARVMRQHG
jgi:cytidylate kinase